MDMNSICVNFLVYGLVPLGDDEITFLTDAPKKIGDDALVCVRGIKRMVRLLRSSGHIKNWTYLVDMGIR